jgi:hypothetical protein
MSIQSDVSSVVIEMIESKVITEITNNKTAIWEEEKLTEEQELIITNVYQEAKEITENIVNDIMLEEFVKTTKLIAGFITLLEKTRINGAKIGGENKKKVVLYLIKRTITELVENKDDLSSLLHVIETTAEHLLETFVETSKMMSFIAEISLQDQAKIIQEAETSCCFWLFKK